MRWIGFQGGTIIQACFFVFSLPLYQSLGNTFLQDIFPTCLMQNSSTSSYTLSSSYFAWKNSQAWQNKKGDMKHLPKLIIHFINCIISTCKREGMGNRLRKNHLYFHLHEYMTQWGLPKGCDSVFSESHHKGSQYKDSTKGNSTKSAYPDQTNSPNRKTEYKNIIIAKLHYQTIEQSVPQRVEKQLTGGSHFPSPDDGFPTMKRKSSSNRSKPLVTNDILQFCRHKILPLQYDKRFVCEFTEHNREDNALQEPTIYFVATLPTG